MAPRLLLLAVPRDAGRVLFPILAPIIGVLFAPLPRAFAASLGVRRIVGKFTAAVVSAPPPLTFPAIADQLGGVALGGAERLLAMRTTARLQRGPPG